MAYFDTGSAGGGLANFGAQTFLTFLNNSLARRQADRDRYQNYYYNEQAAEAADARTRALYSDFYSPEALMQQYKAAGLSPALMFGGTPGQGGTAGAQGHGVAGIQTPFMPMSMVEAAQAAALWAQADKTKEETKNVAQDTKLKELETSYKELYNSQYATEWTILNSTWKDANTGEMKSIFEAARDHYTYESFLEWCRGDKTDEDIKKATTTEAGQRILKSIYEGANRFHRDIMVLSQESVSAEFQMDVINALKNENYIKENAEAVVQQLKAMNASAELTETQKDAWNNLLDRLGSKGSTTRDIVVVLGMILSNFASHAGIKLNVGN